MSSPQKPNFFDRLSKMTDEALRRAGSRRVVTIPNTTQGQPKTPDPRRFATDSSTLPLSKQWEQLSRTQPISLESGWETIESSSSILGMPEPQQVSPEPSPIELHLARKFSRPLARSTRRRTKAVNDETSALASESPLDKVLDSFTKKIRTSETFHELTEDWEDLDGMLQEAREAMQGKQREESPTLESLIERLRDLDDSDAKNWPSPLTVNKRRA